MEPLARQLRWLVVIRLVVITSIALPYFLATFFSPAPVTTPVEVMIPGPSLGESSAPRSQTAPAPEPAAEEPGAGTAEEPADAEPADAEPVAAEPVADPAAGEPAAATETDTAAERPQLRPPTIVVTERRQVGLQARNVYQMVGFGYVASLLYLMMMRWWRRRPRVQAHVQFVGDLLLVTALVYFTGGISSPFTLFYLVIIAVAAMMLRRQGGFITATESYLLYAATLLGIYFGQLPAPETQAPYEDPIYRLTYNLAVHFLGFYAVAFLTSLLAERASRAEAELEEKLESLADLQVVHRDVIQSITSGLATTDVQGRITSLNRAGEEILGTGEREAVGRPIEQLLGPERWHELTNEEAIVPGRSSRYEVELMRGEEPIFVGFSVSPLIDATDNRRGWNVVFQDLTRWRRLENEVRIKDRMAAVGELAAGIAHEIGNPLAAISGSVQMLASSFEGGAPQQKLLSILLKESQRLDRTIKGFLRFARPRERSAVEFDVAHLVAENFELLGNSGEVSAAHHLEIDLDPPSVVLLADPDQVSQVFWNLARNALKAMPEGGRLRVRGRQRGTSFRLTVSDDGHGMSEEQRANLFHPFQSFFDTGSGIGMAIVFRIVEDHGGRIEVESGEGQGTTIVVHLPGVRAAGSTPTAPLQLPPATEGVPR
ncbi:MAG TPA: ATP-binding protein [Thermoanaerobaculia bacterium]|nr:ATP-binding protein [Thermoanaerobaculia bacterium]